MTALTISVTLDDVCNLTVTDTTGFYDPSTNVTGFLPEDNTDDVTFGVYKLSYGYFINVLLYNGYNVAPSILNTNETFSKAPNVVDSTYANNFTPSIYSLINDGTFTLKRYFIISDVFYGDQSGGSLFDSKTVFYTDGTTIFQVVSGTPTPITVSNFIVQSFANATVVEVDSLFISTCHINSCYYKLMSSILDSNLTACYDKSYSNIVADRDLLYMTLEVIKYLQDFNNLTQIQKLIETVDGCCDICTTLTPSENGGCGCG
jgi:hypothetical protein